MPYGYCLLGIALSLLLTLLEWPFRQLLTPSTILMIDLLEVFFVATQFGLWPSIVTSLTNAGCFAYFFATPIFSFAIADQENLVSLAVTLVVGAVTSKQSENIRTQAHLAEKRAQRASAQYSLSKALAEARHNSDIIAIGAAHIHSQFGGKNTLLFTDSHGDGGWSAPDATTVPLADVNPTVAEWVLQNGKAAGQASGHFPDEQALYLPLKGASNTLGVLVLEPAKPQRLWLPEQRQLLATFINQIVHSYERASLAEQAKNATLKMQAETLRNSLLSSISHDLRTPLATLVAAASTLETDAVRLNATRHQELVRAISEEAQRMSELTIKILEMARLEAGEVVLNQQWYETEEIIGSALRAMHKKLNQRPVEVDMSCGQQLIFVDAVLLQQVLVNLLDNANKYAPPEQAITLSVHATAQQLSVVVADNGPGIPAGFEEKIFEKFFQIKPESAQSGVGLGLSICRAIVEAHGGHIAVSRAANGGAVFCIHLPMVDYPPSIVPEATIGASDEP
jgi:two-component system sensor histidine kinase KdpD